MSEYNGWTNYATWRINLEIFDYVDFRDTFNMDQDAYDLGKDLQTYAEDIIIESSGEGLARDYALAFMNDVNWYEIAKHQIEAMEAA